MTSKRSSPRSAAERGVSLSELLVTLTLASITLGSAVRFFATHTGLIRGHGYRLEAQHALRASLDAITRDLRLAGACLPTDGQFIALDGADGGGVDAITIRTGLVRDDLSCIVTAIETAAAEGEATVVVGETDGFTPDMLAYVRHPNGSGQITHVTAAGGGSIGLADGLTQDYPVGSGVYALDERVYTVDQSDPDLPLLVLTVNRGAPQAFAAGLRDLQLEYLLERNCPPCDRVALPADTEEWRLVNAVDLTATVESVGGVRPEDDVTLVADNTAKPRNLLP